MSHRTFLPPEWADQSAIMLTWPHAKTDWNYCLSAINETYFQMADAITRHEQLLIVTPEPDALRDMLEKRLAAEQLAKTSIHKCDTNDTWARDHGFITLTEDNGVPTLLDFHFNGWGEKFRSDLDNDINRSLYASGMVSGTYVDHNDFVLEGGSIESDGNGTVLTTSCCLLAPNRNQPMTRDEIEDYLKSCLHADKIIWLDNGHLEGDDTDGHIDTLVRTAPENTLLYVACDDPHDPQFEDLRKMEKQLKTVTNAAGQPYQLIKLPMPDAIYEDGLRLPATYANFVIINGAVIYPTYSQPDNDRKAAEAIAGAFPGRELIPIDSRTVIRQHGSLHCCTMQMHGRIKI